MLPLRERIANGMSIEQATIDTYKEITGVDLSHLKDDLTITLKAEEYRELVESHNHLYLSMGIMNPDLLCTKRMIKAAEICEKHKPSQE